PSTEHRYCFRVKAEASSPGSNEANASLLQRRGRDSNPRGTKPPLTVFETAPFNHSGTPPEQEKGSRRAAYRLSAKKRRRRSADSPASRPPATSGRWLSRGSLSTSRTLPAAPAFGSSAP